MLKRIAVSELVLGMYIHEFCGSWMDHPFWRGRFLLDNERDLQRVLDSDVSEVWIDVSKGLDVPAGHISQSLEEVEAEAEARLLAAESRTPPVRTSLDHEVQRALKLCAQSKAAVVQMFSDARMGQAIVLEHVAELVEEISDSVLRHPNALISLARLKTSDEYTYMHSVAVCALMIALSRQMGLPEAQVREAGEAGLLHDIGKMAIPDAILNKPGKLTDVEFGTMRRHPEAGAKMLLECRQVSALVLDVCLHHHEKFDGSGYPHRLAGEQISLFARMGAICDVYDAITSDRPYKKGWDPAESIRKMAEWKGHFDPQLFQAFVKSMGIYPIGSLVRLESGRLGVVVEQHEKSLLTPRVKVFFSARSKLPIPQEVIDLARLAGRDKIVGRESAEEWGLKNIEELWSGIPTGKGSIFD
ncbi:MULTISPECIES: HD-GYP domain-containing protein [unclassified Pseudomonas]|uniref:HD-GYP domain-containing protein n=1 Tax=unclassified Pseudomonas TaxID=196821 RepID=UPI00244AB92D|nr:MULTISPECIES: HD-GYP domain-containing protein [unclassified Pseudomonas]MDG9926493.1 HD-GYP domain-containing protein [Pseudomonas sp. GD04042]MDH0481423.1 HD-GYP domain-containing protein [Pseudomonas sp. GD04015]MDH0603372.1 HD-GYP domain-containing protein [Pseudomonas sp. GD03869]